MVKLHPQNPGSRAWLACALLLLAGCCPEVKTADGATAAGDGGASTAGARLSVVQQTLFDRHCVTDCHELVNAAAGLQLVRGKSHSNLVQQPSHQIASRVRVVPGDPDRSYLVQKIIGGAGMVGDRMPRLAPPRPRAEVDLLKAWITRGAPND